MEHQIECGLNQRDHWRDMKTGACAIAIEISEWFYMFACQSDFLFGFAQGGLQRRFMRTINPP